MNTIMIVGYVSMALGACMCIFRKPLAKIFVKLGKMIVGDSRLYGNDILYSMIMGNSIPTVMLILGLINIIQGIAFVVMGYFNYI